MFGYGTPDRQLLPAGQPGLRRSHRAVELRSGEVARRSSPRPASRNLSLTFKVPPAGLCPRGGEIIAAAARRGRHQRRGRQRRVGGVARQRVPGRLRLRPHDRQPRRGQRHRRLRQADYYPNYDATRSTRSSTELNATTDPAKQIELKQAIQTQLAEDYAVALPVRAAQHHGRPTRTCRACGRTRRSRSPTSRRCPGRSGSQSDPLPTEHGGGGIAGSACSPAIAQPDMTSYLAGRLLSLIASLIVASIVIFFVLEVLPGDPAQFMLGHERAARYARGAPHRSSGSMRPPLDPLLRLGARACSAAISASATPTACRSAS